MRAKGLVSSLKWLYPGMRVFGVQRLDVAPTASGIKRIRIIGDDVGKFVLTVGMLDQ